MRIRVTGKEKPMSNIIEITDYEAPELDVYARLTEAQLLNRFEPKKGMFIAESPKVIMRALDAGCQPVSILVEHSRIQGESLEVIERCGDIPVYKSPLRTVFFCSLIISVYSNCCKELSQET